MCRATGYGSTSAGEITRGRTIATSRSPTYCRDLTGFVEHPEVVADRLENVARAVGDPRRVMACTDCGFDTSAGMGRVTEDVVWAKLAAMAEGARIATQRLF